MEKEVLYRKVMCSDRLPEKDGYYIAKSWKGTVLHTFNKVMHTLNKQHSAWLTDIEWWLEEVTTESPVQTILINMLATMNAEQKKYMVEEFIDRGLITMPSESDSEGFYNRNYSGSKTSETY